VSRCVYVEEQVAEHPRARQVLARYPEADAVRIACRHYGEVFNPSAQSFRLQKTNPALILAAKRQRLVLPAPAGYGLGGAHNYYFSHMLNCLYDCRYCFLQGMFRSAHHVLFVNYEDFGAAIDRTLAEHAPGDCWFFSGYDCDSLALDPLTGFADWCLRFFAERPTAHLELRTKSTQIRALLAREALPNVVVAFSFTPEGVHAALEHKVPSLDKRLAAARRLAERGWRLGLRFDPLVYSRDFAAEYTRLFDTVFRALDPGALHSVSYGTFRLPRDFFKTMVAMYPEEPLFAGPLATEQALVGYQQPLESELIAFCTQRLAEHLPAGKLFACAA